MKKNIYLSSYGDENGRGRGIITLTYDGNEYQGRQIYPIDGKVNCIIEDNSYFYVPVKEKEGKFIYIVLQKDGTFMFQRKFKTSYFYNHGLVSDDGYLYVASYEDGVDAIVDISSGKEISIVDHREEQRNGKCHFIDYTPDHNYVFSIENFLQKIYIYKVHHHELQVSSIIKFGDENIRLMPYSSYSECYYLNTEKTNVLYTLKWIENTFVIKDKRELVKGSGMMFSGGNAISADGKFLCVSIRGRNELQYFSIEQDGSLTLLDTVSCGNMPRDITFHEDLILVTCTSDHKVEVYKRSEKLIKIDEIAVFSPITFSL